MNRSCTRKCIKKILGLTLKKLMNKYSVINQESCRIVSLKCLDDRWTVRWTDLRTQPGFREDVCINKNIGKYLDFVSGEGEGRGLIEGRHSMLIY